MKARKPHAPSSTARTVPRCWLAVPSRRSRVGRRPVAAIATASETAMPAWVAMRRSPKAEELKDGSTACAQSSAARVPMTKWSASPAPARRGRRPPAGNAAAGRENTKASAVQTTRNTTARARKSGWVIHHPGRPSLASPRTGNKPFDASRTGIASTAASGMMATSRRNSAVTRPSGWPISSSPMTTGRAPSGRAKMKSQAPR